jgi:type IV pilus assembly protein PilE
VTAVAAPRPPRRPPGRARGFSLPEVMIAVAVVALLAAIALPAAHGQLQRARRADATAALQHIEAAQARHHAQHGWYADRLAALGAAGGAASPQGLYRIELRRSRSDAYTAVARARADGSQSGDAPCAEITLRVAGGFAERGPALSCWRR